MIQKKATARRFKVSAHDNGYYCVSIPGYEGGHVVNTTDYDALLVEVARLQAALTPFVTKSPDINGMSGSDIVTLPVLVREVKAARTALVGKAIQ